MASQGGFTIVEVMVAILILLVGVLGTVALIDGANRATGQAKAREGATNLSREIVEAARSLPYRDLEKGGNKLENQLKTIGGLADASPGTGTYTIRRRNFTYTVTADVCTFDDDKDGLGTNNGGNFCDGLTAGTTDRNPDDYKRVTVTVSWDAARGARGTNTQTSIISNPGGNLGPSVVSVNISSPVPAVANPITFTDPTINNINFSFNTSSTPASVIWYRDGVPQNPLATFTGTAGSFSWNVKPVGTSGAILDGTYKIAVEAFDSAGDSGATITRSITLNRSTAAAPSNFQAGRNGSINEFLWRANTEGDIVGYRVYEETGATDRLVCPGSAATPPITNTECTESSPPASATYYVVAVDRDTSGNFREGAASSPDTVVAGTNNAPFSPANLSACTGADTGCGTTDPGQTLISWDPPSPEDPDAGDTIAFYRIYRDGNGLADRYDVWFPTQAGGRETYIDGNQGTAHTYYVTAVDQDFAESPLLGPVTR